MWKIRQMLASLMYGRYGIDRLYWVLLGVWFVMSAVNIFIGSLVLTVLELAVMTVAFWRAFSRNIYQRRRENEQFANFINGIKAGFSLFIKRVRDFKYKRYRRCKACKAVLRLPVNRGTHTVRCPKCAREFKVKILI